ncbi:MAG: L,D-transpeptidase family protein [Roseiarcus sp.]
MLGKWRRRLMAACLTASLGALVAGCNDPLMTAGPESRASTPIPDKVLAKMDEIGTTPGAPMLIRAYKQEAEFEVWKQTSDGRYALLKTYPICRWSGQLGPKRKEGDFQVPEGFYTITPSQMNPNSNYYLSFNVGYPNAYDRAHGGTGGTIMVHGVCSSAGCFSMTDAGIAEIYALAREAFEGGQREIQMQSYPFHMTAINLAKHRLDPNIAFWKELKNGSDHFKVTLSAPSVLVCDKHYVFGAAAKGEVSPTAACPALTRDAEVETAVAQQEAKDAADVAALVGKGVKPVEIVYADGGQNKVFAGRVEGSDPDALAEAPREIALDSSGKPNPPVVQVAAADNHVASATSQPVSAPAKPAPKASGPAPGFFDAAGHAGETMAGLIDRMTGKTEPQQIQVFEPAEPIPSDAPLPPKRPSMLLRVANVAPDTDSAAQ